MNEALLWVILLCTAVTAVLVVVLLNRASRLPGRREGGARRTANEPRGSPECGRELREEVSAGLRATTDTLTWTLESMGKVQQTRWKG